MSVRIYTFLTTGQRKALDKMATDGDRSLSYLIARAVNEHIGDVSAEHVGRVASRSNGMQRAFARTSAEAADQIRARAFRHSCYDWQAVNAAVEIFLEANN